ncbi:hypothetical protein D049_3783A, partial [Vibrio parahaemolyticus VPTS-2010]
MIESFTQSD